MDLGERELEEAFLRLPEIHFRDVYDRYSGSLFRFLYRFTHNNQASEEILHDTFIELLNGRFKAADSGTLKSWLFTVAKNRGLNHRKKSLRDAKEDISLIRSNNDLENETIHASLLTHLSKAENKLPTDLKETWNLRKNGHDYQEIAKALAIPVGTVKSRFARLVELLRKEFES